MKIKKFNENIDDLDPYGEEEWDEIDKQIFYDDETGVTFEFDPTKKDLALGGWVINDLFNDKLENHIKKKFKTANKEKDLLWGFFLGFEMREKIEEYKKKLK